MATKVTLREKKISNGRKSLYLDFYPPIKHPETGKPTRREFLGMFTYEKPRTVTETQHNKDARHIAETIRNKRFVEVANNTYGIESKRNNKLSFLDFFQQLVDVRYTSEGNYGNWKSANKYLTDYFENGLTFGELSSDVMEEFKEYLISLDLSQNTKSSYFAKLKAAVKDAFKRGLIPKNYGLRVEAIKPGETSREFVTLEELKVLAQTECENEQYKQAFIFSALTGLRFSDIEKMKWKEISGTPETGYTINFEQKKTKSEQYLTIPTPAYNLLGERGERESKVFQGLNYTAWNNQKLKLWVSNAGIKKKITFHCARHSFATIQLTLGTDIYTVSKLLGHKELKTTQIYAKIIDKKRDEAMNKLNDFEF